MKIGIAVGDVVERGSRLADQVQKIHAYAEAGFPTVWLGQLFGVDALTAIAVAGSQVPHIELGTAVVPTFPRHPTSLTMQALTTQAAIGGRLTLGVGPSHRSVIEDMFGLDYSKPARHMREYLAVLGPLLRGERVDFTGETLRINARLRVPGAAAPALLAAALGPVMLRLAAEFTDGTVTWMTGPTTLAEHTAPGLARAAQELGRPAPRLVAGLPICLTADSDRARQWAARQFATYAELPNYRAMLDREGAAGPADVAIVGDENAVRAGVARLAEAGATDFMAVPFGSSDEVGATVELLASLARSVERAGAKAFDDH